MRFLILLSALLLPLSGFTASGSVVPPKHDWSFKGVRADWDKDQLLRGYTVATQVCLACHSFKYISHRNLTRAGFSEADARALADEMGIDVNQAILSSLTPADAAEVYGKPVPDLSVMNKARPHGADYVYALMTGYEEAIPAAYAAEFPNGIPEGGSFNHYFPGHIIAMPAPLTEGAVTFHDGREATVAHMAEDVTYFLQWTAEPELMERKRLGIYVLIYLVLFTLLAYAVKRQIWRDVH